MTSQLTKKEWSLKKETELRCEVPENSTLIVKVTSGFAEIFGVELGINREYTFRDQNFAIFTWYSCNIETSEGSGVGLYVADSTPMTAYVNTHIQLEARRDVALANDEYGPRVMIVGPMDHGKSSITQILTTYAIRLDRTPILVDLDVGQSITSIPGTISAIPLEKYNLSVEEGFINYNPLIYYFGHASPRENTEHYKSQVTTLAKQVYQRLEKDADAKSSGLIVNTTGWVDKEGYDLLLHCCSVFMIDILLVMGHDKLYSHLMSTYEHLPLQYPVSTAMGPGSAGAGSGGIGAGNNKMIIVKLPVSGGVVTRDANARKRIRKNKIGEYFYGRFKTFSPERREIYHLATSGFIFLRVGGVQLSEGMRIFMDESSAASGHQSASRLVKVDPTADLAYTVAAVLHGSFVEALLAAGDQDNNNSNSGSSALITKQGEVNQQLLQANVAGFVTILSILPQEDRMSLLTPCPGELPSRYLLLGSIKWME